MEHGPIGMVNVSAPSFPKAARLVRESLMREGLAVVAVESSEPANQTLYVVCPFLLLQTLTFDRPSAVFVPAHVVLSAAATGAEVRWLNRPATAMAAGAAGPIQALHARIGSAIRSLGERKRPFLFRGNQRSSEV